MSWVYDFSDPDAVGPELLGGKGAGMAKMTELLGAEKVPAGFTITTAACVEYLQAGGTAPAGLEEQVDAAVAKLEERAGKRLGDPADPLLVSVRSGGRVSMPGMLDTVLNLGLGPESLVGLVARTGNERFAWDAYRRLVQMFGNVVRGIDSGRFEEALREARTARGVSSDAGLDAGDLRALTTTFLGIFEHDLREPLPADPREQLRQAIEAVFDSWNGERAISYRRLYGIPDEWGTAVNVQQMVFGNQGESSGSGVVFSRDERTGEPAPSGDFLFDAQGEDVVAGIRDPEDLAELKRRMPKVHAELLEVLGLLERQYGDMQDVEFTVEQGRLYLLQTRAAKRPAQAAVRFARDAVAEGLLSREQALQTIDADTLDALLHPVFDPDFEYELLARGVAASPGAAKGAIVFSATEAVRRAGAGEDVILVRQFTAADDVEGFAAARGIITAEGGKASHAALVARGMGRPCVAGASTLRVDAEAGVLTVGGTSLEAGELIAIEGSSGTITRDDVPLIEPEIGDDFREVLAWSDEIRRLGVRANADTPTDAAKAVEMGAEGIGLCRTEHMFFGEDRTELVRSMFVAAERWRRALREAEEHEGAREAAALARDEFEASLESLGELQRADLTGILHEMRGRPVTVRLLDPPLHEFLPLEHFEAELVRLQAGGSEDELAAVRAAAEIVRELQEANPMLGTRGIRLGILYPQIYEMQVAAAVAAAADAAAAGQVPHLEIMLPLVAYETELEPLRKTVVAAAQRAMVAAGTDVPCSVGTMIELPRACLVADRLAGQADFFSFGTNDLTQTTLGFSRDDVEGSFIPAYLEQGIIDRSPFEALDRPGVGELIRIGVEKGRSTNAKLSCGICGEHGADPDSIRFFEEVGLDYVSCSPYRVPVARIAAAQAAIAAR